VGADPDDGATAARKWLESRITAAATEAAQVFLRETAEALSIASGDATSIRVLSAGGTWLFPLAAHHPNGAIQRAMNESMRQSAERADSGLWVPVINERRLVMFDITDRTIPVDASPSQAAFLRRYPVTRVMGVPVIDRADVVGGVSLVRFVDERQFSEADCALLADVAARAARAIDFGRLRHLDPEGLT
jgi:GAF domain-containing protein